MRIITVLLAIALVTVLATPLAAQSKTKGQPAVDPLKQAYLRIEKAFFNVRTAAAFAVKSDGVDLTQAIRALAEAELRLNQAMTLVREIQPKTAKSAPPSRDQVAKVERLVDEALKQVREAGRIFEAALKNRQADLKKIGFYVKQADKNAEAAMKMLPQVVAGR